MSVEITYTNINGLTRKATVSSPDEAMEALNGMPGYAKVPMDELAAGFVEKMKGEAK